MNLPQKMLYNVVLYKNVQSWQIECKGEKTATLFAYGVMNSNMNWWQIEENTNHVLALSLSLPRPVIFVAVSKTVKMKWRSSLLSSELHITMLQKARQGQWPRQTNWLNDWLYCEKNLVALGNITWCRKASHRWRLIGRGSLCCLWCVLILHLNNPQIHTISK